MRQQTVIQMSIQRLACSGCGAEAHASCNCGKPYLPAKMRAREAIEANPQKSDRAIAADIGVSHETVSKARRESPVNELTPEREGRDGKIYRLPVRDDDPEDDADTPQEIAARRKNSFLLSADEARRHAFYQGSVDREVAEAARQTADAWNQLANTLERVI